MTRLPEIDIFVNILKVYLLSAYTYFLATKNMKIQNYNKYKKVITFVVIFIIAIISGSIRWSYNFFNSTIVLIFLLSFVFAINTKNDMAYSLCIIAISLSVSYILYFLSIWISYIPRTYIKN